MGTFYNKQINNKHIIYQRGVLYHSAVVSVSISEMPFHSPLMFSVYYFHFKGVF